MSKITHFFTFGLCLANMLPNGFSLRLEEQETELFGEVSRELPVADCDLIVVSSSPFQGEKYELYMNLSYMSVSHEIFYEMPLI